MRNCLEIIWIFWECFKRNLWEKFFWDDFLEGILWAELFSRNEQGIDTFVNILGYFCLNARKEGRKEGGFLTLRRETQTHST